MTALLRQDSSKIEKKVVINAQERHAVRSEAIIVREKARQYLTAENVDVR